MALLSVGQDTVSPSGPRHVKDPMLRWPDLLQSAPVYTTIAPLVLELQPGVRVEGGEAFTSLREPCMQSAAAVAFEAVLSSSRAVSGLLCMGSSRH